MSLPALARRAAQSLLAQHGSSSGTAAAAGRLLFSTSSGTSSSSGGRVVEVGDDAALAAALATSAAAGEASVVNFTAAWCGPCKAMVGPLSDLAKQYPSVAFIKADIDAPGLAKSVAEAGVSAVPTYLVRARGGKTVLETIQGARLELLQKAVAAAAGAGAK
jgi:thioredoxin 1